jgi:hypothetical protein
MDPKWDDEQIKKALKGRVSEEPRPEVSDRAWASIERTLRERGTNPAGGPVTEDEWDDTSVREALRGKVPEDVPEVVAERTWAAVERSIREGGRPKAWEDLGFFRETGLRYAAAILLFLAGIGSALEYKSYRQEGNIASYLETLLERGQDSEEEGPIWVSALLTEPLDEGGAGIPSEDDDDELGIEEGEAWL